jgi:hypothetical protein
MHLPETQLLTKMINALFDNPALPFFNQTNLFAGATPVVVDISPPLVE